MTRAGACFVLVAVLALLAFAHAQSEVAAVATAPEQSQQKPAPESSPVMPVEGAVTSVMAVSNPEVATISPSTSPAMEVTVAVQPTAVKDPPVEETAVVTTASTEVAPQTVQITAVPVSAEQPKPASGSEVSTTKVHTRGDAAGKTKQCAPGERLSKANKVLSCQPCLPGHYQDKHSSAGRCKTCPAGTYASGKGSTKCKKCPKGKSSKAGQKACVTGAKKSSSSGKKPAPKPDAGAQPNSAK